MANHWRGCWCLCRTVGALRIREGGRVARVAAVDDFLQLLQAAEDDVHGDRRGIGGALESDGDTSGRLASTARLSADPARTGSSLLLDFGCLFQSPRSTGAFVAIAVLRSTRAHAARTPLIAAWIIRCTVNVGRSCRFFAPFSLSVASNLAQILRGFAGCSDSNNGTRGSTSPQLPEVDEICAGCTKAR